MNRESTHTKGSGKGKSFLFAGIVAALSIFVVGCGTATVAPVKTTHAAAAPKTVAVSINHVVKGCHVLSVNGGALGASKTAKLPVGGTLTIANNDLMPHTLLQTKGTTVKVAGAKMASMGAKSSVSFPQAGTYRFVTKAGEDYPSAGKFTTTGEDNALKLTIVVS